MRRIHAARTGSRRPPKREAPDIRGERARPTRAPDTRRAPTPPLRGTQRDQDVCSPRRYLRADSGAADTGRTSAIGRDGQCRAVAPTGQGPRPLSATEKGLVSYARSLCRPSSARPPGRAGSPRGPAGPGRRPRLGSPDHGAGAWDRVCPELCGACPRLGHPPPGPAPGHRARRPQRGAHARERAPCRTGHDRCAHRVAQPARPGGHPGTGGGPRPALRARSRRAGPRSRPLQGPQ